MPDIRFKEELLNDLENLHWLTVRWQECSDSTGPSGGRGAD